MVRLDVVNLFDEVYQIRSGSGIGVFAPQYGSAVIPESDCAAAMPGRETFIGCRFRGTIPGWPATIRLGNTSIAAVALPVRSQAGLEQVNGICLCVYREMRRAGDFHACARAYWIAVMIVLVRPIGSISCPAFAESRDARVRPS